MMRVKLAACLALVVAAFASPAGAAGTPVVVSGPGSFLVNYTQPVVVASPGDTVTYINGDIQRHDIVADGAYRPDGSAVWCTLFESSECPLFWTPLISLGQQTTIQGLEDVEAGTTYDFLCTIHQNMYGILVAA